MLLEDVGRPRVVEDVPTELVEAVLAEMGAGASEAAAEGGAG